MLPGGENRNAGVETAHGRPRRFALWRGSEAGGRGLRSHPPRGRVESSSAVTAVDDLTVRRRGTAPQAWTATSGSSLHRGRHPQAAGARPRTRQRRTGGGLPGRGAPLRQPVHGLCPRPRGRSVGACRGGAAAERRQSMGPRRSRGQPPVRRAQGAGPPPKAPSPRSSSASARSPSWSARSGSPT